MFWISLLLLAAVVFIVLSVVFERRRKNKRPIMTNKIKLRKSTLLKVRLKKQPIPKIQKIYNDCKGAVMRRSFYCVLIR